MGKLTGKVLVSNLHERHIQPHHKISALKENVHTNGDYIIKHPDATTYNITKPIQIEVSPQSWTAATFTGQQVQFRIQPSLCGEIELVLLELQCAETGGTNSVTPIVAPFLVNNIAIYYKTLGKPLQTIDANSLYCQFQWANKSEIDNFIAFNALNMNSTYVGESAISASGSATFSIPLLFSILNGLDPKTLNGDIIIIVTLRNGATASGSGTLTLNDLRLRIQSREDPHHDSNIQELISKQPVLHPYVDPVVFEITQTVTASIQHDINVQLTGNFAAWLVLIRSSTSATSSGLRTFSPIGGITNLELRTGVLDVLDNKKVSIFHSANRPGYYRSIYPALHGGYDMSTQVASYWVVFTEHDNFGEVLKHGLKFGGLVCDNDHYLRITPGSTFSTGTFTITVVGYSFHEAMVKYGEIIQTM